MGLDIYVGPLCRYYAGDWKTVVQRYGRETGTQVQAFARTIPKAPSRARRSSGPSSKRGETDSPRRCETRTSPFHGRRIDKASISPTSRPGIVTRRCCSGLRISSIPSCLARRMEATTGAKIRPSRRSRDPTFKTRFPHLLIDTEFWLPGDFAFTFAAGSLPGAEVRFGSSSRLMQELADINRASWNGDAEAIAQWRTEGGDHGATLEVKARFCCALMLQLCEAAVRHRLPMKLDY